MDRLSGDQNGFVAPSVSLSGAVSSELSGRSHNAARRPTSSLRTRDVFHPGRFSSPSPSARHLKAPSRSAPPEFDRSTGRRRIVTAAKAIAAASPARAAATARAAGVRDGALPAGEALSSAPIFGVGREAAGERERRSSVEWNRMAGVFSRQRSTMRTTGAGMCRSLAESSAGCSWRIADIVSAGVSLRNAGWPESISYRIAPNEKMSDLVVGWYAANLLRRHVAERPEDQSRLRAVARRNRGDHAPDAADRFRLRQFGQTEIENPRDRRWR